MSCWIAPYRNGVRPHVAWAVLSVALTACGGDAKPDPAPTVDSACRHQVNLILECANDPNPPPGTDDYLESLFVSCRDELQQDQVRAIELGCEPELRAVIECFASMVCLGDKPNFDVCTPARDTFNQCLKHPPL